MFAALVLVLVPVAVEVHRVGVDWRLNGCDCGSGECGASVLGLCCPLRARAAFERLSASRVSRKNAELFPPWEDEATWQMPLRPLCDDEKKVLFIGLGIFGFGPWGHPPMFS